MAIFIPGMPCAVCGCSIGGDDDPVLFPAFVANRLDPLWRFSDAVVHRACLQSHALGQEALRRSRDVIVRCGPGSRKCAVCGDEIMDPGDYFGTGYLGPEASLVGKFNYLHLHRSHFWDWDRADEFRAKMTTYLESDAWDGPTLTFDPLPKFIAAARPGRE